MSPAEVVVISLFVTVSVLVLHLLLRGPISRAIHQGHLGRNFLVVALAVVAAVAASAMFEWRWYGPIPAILAAGGVVLVALLGGAFLRWLRGIPARDVLVTLALAFVAAVAAMAVYPWHWYGYTPAVLAAAGVVTVAATYGGIAHLLRSLRGWHLVVIALAAFLLLAATAPYPGPALVVGLAEGLVLFGWGWSRQFRFLMAQPDDAFPGRFDKPIWAALMILLPPLGLPTFWAYRRAHWPEPKSQAAAAVHELA